MKRMAGVCGAQFKTSVLLPDSYHDWEACDPFETCTSMAREISLSSRTVAAIGQRDKATHPALSQKCGRSAGCSEECVEFPELSQELKLLWLKLSCTKHSSPRHAERMEVKGMPS